MVSDVRSEQSGVVSDVRSEQSGVVSDVRSEQSGVVSDVRSEQSGVERFWAVAAEVPDPEMPMLTIADLGVLRAVRVAEGRVEADITPTYSGCPAIDAIRADVERALVDAGAAESAVRLVLSPAWSTDWITDAGRRKLREHGIAPPPEPRGGGGPVLVAATLTQVVRCPQCGSADTAELSRFGATACTALWRCVRCREPFEHVKAH